MRQQGVEDIGSRESCHTTFVSWRSIDSRDVESPLLRTAAPQQVSCLRLLYGASLEVSYRGLNAAMTGERHRFAQGHVLPPRL